MRGAPDFGMYAPKETTTSISDMGEVAARLGSIVTYDKRGDVVMFDDFEGPLLKAECLLDGVGSYGRYDNTYARSGAQSLLLHTGADIDGRVDFIRGASPLVSLRLGMEWSFCYLEGDRSLRFQINRTSNGKESQAAVLIYPETEELCIRGSDGSDTKIADTGIIGAAAFMFHTVKFVVDFTTGKYVRLLFDDKEWDITDEAYQVRDSLAYSQVACSCRLKNILAVAGNVWLDDFILTQAEP